MGEGKDHAADQPQSDWERLAREEIKGDPAGLTWQTPEGIGVKPLYTAADLEGIEAVDALPGFPDRGGPR